MTVLRALFLCLLPQVSLACDAAVCLVDPDTLALTQVITFDEVRGGGGPGLRVDDILQRSGARFGEHFAGQTVAASGDFDRIDGTPLPPLTLLAGVAGQNLSLVFFSGNTVLNGYGIAGFPKRNAQGEGAIGVQFDAPQSAIAFDLRGGEAGVARVDFFRDDGSLIGTVLVEPTGEFAVGFARKDGIGDITGIVITNSDPQGLAIDTLRFGKPLEIG